jgi:RNA polymerase sigma-70 factor (ECF subfamily)
VTGDSCSGPDDAQLVRRAQQGDAEAFEVLVRRYGDQVFRLALRLVVDRHAAEDIAQEAFVAAWRGIPDFRRDAAFPTWLHSIVLNRARNHLTRARATQRLPEEMPAAAAQQPDAAVQSLHRDKALRAAIRGLPFDLRAPLVLHQFERWSYEEIAEILGLSVSTVRGRIARARRALLTSMREWQ